MADDKLERYIQNSPKVLKTGNNPVVTALIKAFASGDSTIVDALSATKAQLFVRTAEGQYLDRLSSSVGVRRPSEIGLLDDKFQDLIPNLSLKPKQIRKIFYDTMDVFWGPLYSRANTTTSNFDPFNVNIGDYIDISVDGGATQQLKIKAGDLVSPGAATATELVNLLNARITGITASIVQDQLTGEQFLNLRTNTPGPRGSVQVFSSSTMVSPTKLDFNTRENKVTDLSQRTVVYEIVNKELIIEIPAVVPSLRRTLRGSHHFHTDATLEAPVPTANGIWAGSFMFSRQNAAFTVTGGNARIQEVIQAGQVYTKVTVDDSTKIPNKAGFLVFDYGKTNQEEPVPYLSVPNTNTVLLNASHVFQRTHGINSYINFILPALTRYVPRINGQDLPIYLTSPVNARQLIQTLLTDLAAEGVLVTFVILLPDFRYITFNPYE